MKTVFLAFTLLITCFFTGCKKDATARKIIDAVPVNAETIVLPANALQLVHLLRHKSSGILVPVLKRLAISGATFPELTSIGGSMYTFAVSDGRFGSTTFTITFRDASNATIDPVQVFSSSSTLKSVVLTGSGGSALFSYSENLVLTLTTAGDAFSVLHLMGTSSLNGSGHALTFTYPGDGISVNALGPIGGTIQATGTGPNGPVNVAVSYNTSNEANGTISWETQSGTLHIDARGSILIVSEQSKIVVD